MKKSCLKVEKEEREEALVNMIDSKLQETKTLFLSQLEKLEAEIRTRMNQVLPQNLKEQFQRLLDWKERIQGWQEEAGGEQWLRFFDINENQFEFEKREVQELISQIKKTLGYSEEDPWQAFNKSLDESGLENNDKQKLKRYWRSFCDTLVAIERVFQTRVPRLDSPLRCADLLSTLVAMGVSVSSYKQVGRLLLSIDFQSKFQRMRRLADLYCLKNLAGKMCNDILNVQQAQKIILGTKELPKEKDLKEEEQETIQKFCDLLDYEEQQEKLQIFCDLLQEDEERKIKSLQMYQARHGEIEQKLGHYHACQWIQNYLLNFKEGKKLLLQITNSNLIINDLIFKDLYMTLPEVINLR